MSKNKIIIYCYSISLNGTVVIVNYELKKTPQGDVSTLILNFSDSQFFRFSDLNPKYPNANAPRIRSPLPSGADD